MGWGAWLLEAGSWDHRDDPLTHPRLEPRAASLLPWCRGARAHGLGSPISAKQVHQDEGFAGQAWHTGAPCREMVGGSGDEGLEPWPAPGEQCSGRGV